MTRPFRIGIVIPVLNEINNLRVLLKSLNDQSRHDLIDRIIIAAGDEDINEYENLSFHFSNIAEKIKVLQNQKKITPAALNIGIKECIRNRVDVVQFFGAHSIIDNNFISKLHLHIQENPLVHIFNSSLKLTEAENYKERAIQLFTYSRLGRNWKSFLSPSEGFITGIFAVKIEIFEKTGLFDERFIKNQDLQFVNTALKNNFRVKLFTDMIYYYKVRPTIKGTLKQMFTTGRYISIDFKNTNLKHLAPFLFYTLVLILFFAYIIGVGSVNLNILIFVISLYLFVNIIESTKYLFKKEKSALLLPLLFVLSHFVYAAGTFYGLYDRIKKG